MISKELFYKKMKEAKELTGSRLTREGADLIYKKIYNDYTDDDFERAIFSALSEGDIYYPNLLKWLDYYREVRLEKQEEENKKKERQELASAWQSLLKEDVKNGCQYSYRCSSCPKEYCDIVGYYGLRLIFSILEGKKGALQTAAETFPDIWGKYGNVKL